MLETVMNDSSNDLATNAPNAASPAAPVSDQQIADELNRADWMDAPPPPDLLHESIDSTSFLCLMAVQFLTVLNDNTF